MNDLAIRQENAVVISVDTKELVEAGVSNNSLKTYRKVLLEQDKRLDTEFDDTVLAEYVIELH